LMGQPAVRDGYVYVGTLGGEVYGFQVESGQSRWPAIVLGSAVRASPVWLGDQMVVATEAGKLVSIDAATGAQTDFYAATGGTLAEPAVVGTVLYVGTTAGQVYALDATLEAGPLAWVYPKPAVK
jgi:outer membrane protein assembly factor BamB